MARGARATVEVSDQARQLLAKHQREADPLEVASRLAREILDEALAHGQNFDRALGAIYLGGMQAYEGRPRRGRRSKNGEGQGDDGERA